MSNEIITKKYLINGPNNVVRLTDGKKVIYIFGEFHYEANEQNECAYSDKYDSMDIEKFLLKFIKTEKNKNYDLFVEMYDNDYKAKDYISFHRYNYIEQIRKLFQSKIIIDNNKILLNKKYPNFKFHFFDIRNKLIDNNKIYYYYYLDIEAPYSQNKLLTIKRQTEELIITLNNLLLQLKNTNHEYINKLLNSYENIKIKNTINKIINNICKYNTKNTIQQCNELLEFIKSNHELLEDKFYNKKKFIKMHVKVYLKVDKINTNIQSIYCLLADLYLIRRVLEKDYITNTIVYTGIAHMTDIIYILIKYFNFKLTNIYYSTENNINILNNLIINLKSNNFEYQRILEKYLYKEDYNDDEYRKNTQCVNLLDFPDNFT